MRLKCVGFFKVLIPMVLALLLVSSFLLVEGHSQNLDKREKIKEHILHGLDLFFNYDFARGEQEFDKVIEIDPENPSGYLFKALGLMAQPTFRNKSQSKDSKELNASLNTSIDDLLQKVTEKGQEAISKSTNDSSLYLMVAVAHALTSVRDLDRNSPIKALREAKKGRAYLFRGLELDPQNYDLYYGLGLLDYYVGNMKGLYGALVSTVFFRGDKVKGINELEIAAEKGLYAKESARAELFYIFVNSERNFPKAIPLGYELVKKFPNNPEFYFFLAYALSEVKNWNEALEVAGKIKERIESSSESGGGGSFWEHFHPRYWHLMGKINLDKGELEIAREYLEKAAAVKEKDFLWIQALAFSRLGMIYDLKLQRERALEYYEKALEAFPGGAGGELAKKYIDNPYAR